MEGVILVENQYILDNVVLVLGSTRWHSRQQARVRMCTDAFENKYWDETPLFVCLAKIRKRLLEKEREHIFSCSVFVTRTLVTLPTTQR